MGWCPCRPRATPAPSRGPQAVMPLPHLEYSVDTFMWPAITFQIVRYFISSTDYITDTQLRVRNVSHVNICHSKFSCHLVFRSFSGPHPKILLQRTTYSVKISIFSLMTLPVSNETDGHSRVLSIDKTGIYNLLLVRLN